jgi:hypothetical protein
MGVGRARVRPRRSSDADRGTRVDVKSAPHAKHTASRKASFTRAKIPTRASQFSLKINKREGS